MFRVKHSSKLARLNRYVAYPFISPDARACDLERRLLSFPECLRDSSEAQADLRKGEALCPFPEAMVEARASERLVVRDRRRRRGAERRAERREKRTEVATNDVADLPVAVQKTLRTGAEIVVAGVGYVGGACAGCGRGD